MTIEIEILAYLGWVLLSTVAIILIMATLRQGAKWLLRVHLKPYPTLACVLGGYAILATVIAVRAALGSYLLLGEGLAFFSPILGAPLILLLSHAAWGSFPSEG